MEIPYEIGQKVYVEYYDDVREVTIKRIIVDEGDNNIRLVTDIDTYQAKYVYTNPHEAFYTLRNRVCAHFQARLEEIDKAEESYLNFQLSNEQE